MFLPGSGRIDIAIWMHYLDANKTTEQEARRQLHRNVESNICYILTLDPAQKCYSKVIHRKEVTRSNGQ